MVTSWMQIGDGEPFPVEDAAIELTPARPPQRPAPGGLLVQGSFEVTFDAADTDGPLWRCPGCGGRYEDLPLGHSWTRGAGCAVAEPVGPADFYEQTRRQT